MKLSELKAALSKIGINTKDGKVKKSDIIAALKTVTADEDDDKDLEWLMSELDIGEDGMAVFNSYAEKFGANAEDLEDVYQLLENFVSDVEEYAMPAVKKMMAYIEKEGE